MPILIVMGIIGLLILRAVLTRPTVATLDKGIPPAVADAVIYAWGNEPNAKMRLAFARVLAKNGYPLAANTMSPGAGSTAPAARAPIVSFKPGTFTVAR